MTGRPRAWLPWLKYAIAALIAVFLLTLLLKTDRLKPGLILEARNRPTPLLLAQAFFLVQLLLTFVRWHLLLRAFQVEARFRDVMRLGWIGLLFSQVIPGSTGGDLVKGFYIARESPDRRAEAVLSVVLDRIFGLVGLMILAGGALVFNLDTIAGVPALQTLAWAVALALLAVLCVGGVLSWESLWRDSRLFAWIQNRLPGGRLVHRLATALWALPHKGRVVTGALGVSVLAHGCGICMHWFLGQALLGDGQLELDQLFFLVPVGQLATALPVLPAGAVVGETVYSFLFEIIEQPNGADLMVLVRLSWILWSVVGVFYYLRGRKALEKIALEAEEKHDEVGTETDTQTQQCI